jgi:hypothetical protein
MTLGQGVEIGPFSFTVIRMLVAVGILRVVIRHERVVGGLNGLDKLIIAWSVWALISSAFHRDPSSALVFRLGLVYNTCGIYFLLRIFCQSIDDVLHILRITGLLLAPVAVEMIYEKLTMYNLFSVLGGVSETPAIRHGAIRAQGPFRHAILAGTVGAVCLPLLIALRKHYPRTALLGISACLTMVLTCASSGPILSGLVGLGALVMWRFRPNMRLARWGAVLGYLALELVMKAPAYYIIARVPAVKGSTGWHRARLIESSIQHLPEWWFAGTDYTRHWMPTGVSWSPDHTDITNHYLKMGVWGGLPLMFLFIACLAKAFSFVGQILKHLKDQSPQKSFLVWSLGASLFAHAATMISVSYFDQSFLFLYLVLASIGSIYSQNKDEIAVEK